MKLLRWFFFAALFAPAVGSSSASIVQNTTAITENGVLTSTIDLASPFTPGNTACATYAGYAGGGGFDVTGVTDDQGNGAYTRVVAIGPLDNNRLVMYCKENAAYISGSFSITATFTGSTSYLVNLGFEVGGVPTSSVVRGTPATNAVTTPGDPGTVSSDSAPEVGDLIVAAVNVVRNTTDVGLGAAATVGYTNLGYYTNYTAIDSLSVDAKAVASGGVQSATWANNTAYGASEGAQAIMVVFKTAGGGGSAPSSNIILQLSN